MNYFIYRYALSLALPLMIFFGAYFILARTPDKAIYDNYIRSRRIMGVALLLLAANYSVHFFAGLRFRDVNAAILMNLSTYFLCYWLFSSALTTLLDRFYLTRKRFLAHIYRWLAFTALSGVVLLWLPDGIVQNIGLLVMALWLMVYGVVLARRLIIAYRRAVRIFDDTHSDHIGAYIRWLSIFTYWAVLIGVGCGLLTFLPDEYIYLWIISSIPFYIYLFCSYMNYLLFYERVEQVLEAEITEDTPAEEVITIMPDDMPACFAEIEPKINDWIKTNGFTLPGLSIEDVAQILDTNRTYLSLYIREKFNTSFREWITDLRLVYAQQILAEYPEITITSVSETAGFLSRSHFTRVFTQKIGCTPTRWMKSKENEQKE